MAIYSYSKMYYNIPSEQPHKHAVNHTILNWIRVKFDMALIRLFFFATNSTNKSLFWIFIYARAESAQPHIIFWSAVRFVTLCGAAAHAWYTKKERGKLRCGGDVSHTKLEYLLAIFFVVVRHHTDLCMHYEWEWVLCERIASPIDASRTCVTASAPRKHNHNLLWWVCCWLVGGLGRLLCMTIVAAFIRKYFIHVFIQWTRNCLWFFFARVVCS